MSRYPHQHPTPHQRVEAPHKPAGQARVIEQHAGLDIPLLCRLGEVRRGHQRSRLIDDHALRVQARPLVAAVAQPAEQARELAKAVKLVRNAHCYPNPIPNSKTIARAIEHRVRAWDVPWGGKARGTKVLRTFCKDVLTHCGFSLDLRGREPMPKPKQESLYSSPEEGFAPAFRRPGLSTETRRKLKDSGKLNAPPHRKPKRAKRDADPEPEPDETLQRPAGRRESRQIRRIKRGRLVKRSVRLPIDIDDELLDMVEEDGSTLTDTLKTLIHAEWVRRRRTKRRRRSKKVTNQDEG